MKHYEAMEKPWKRNHQNHHFWKIFRTSRATSPGCWRVGANCTGGGRLQGEASGEIYPFWDGRMGVKFQDGRMAKKDVIEMEKNRKDVGLDWFGKLLSHVDIFLRRSLPLEYLCSIVFLQSWRRHWKRPQATPTKASRRWDWPGECWENFWQIPWLQFEKSDFPLFDGPFFGAIPLIFAQAKPPHHSLCYLEFHELIFHLPQKLPWKLEFSALMPRLLRISCGGFLCHGVTPSHHPFLDMIFPNKNHLWEVYTPIYGKPPFQSSSLLITINHGI